MVWYSHLSQNFPQFIVIHTVKGFGIVNKAEINVFLELSWFFDDPVDIGNLIFGSSAFSKTSLNIWKFTVHVLLKPGLENFEHYFSSVWDECNCSVVWAFFGIALTWDWNENWPFPVLWPLLSFPNLLAYWVQHTYSITFQDLKQLNWNPITSTKTSQSNHTRTTALSNSVKPSHAHGANQDGRVMEERSDRMWSTGEGNGKLLQYSCLENPMNNMKRQKGRNKSKDINGR